MEEEQRDDLGNHSFLATAAKTILSLNLGTVLRTVLGGFREGSQSLERTYEAVSPFYPIKHGKGPKLYDSIPEVTLNHWCPSRSG